METADLLKQLEINYKLISNDLEYASHGLDSYMTARYGQYDDIIANYCILLIIHIIVADHCCVQQSCAGLCLGVAPSELFCVSSECI